MLPPAPQSECNAGQGPVAPGARPSSPASLATAAALVPLVAHRLLEHLSARVPSSVWTEVCYHLLPPIGMIVASLFLWRSAPPLPGIAASRVSRGQRAIAIAAGLLLGALAAAANLLSFVASGGAGPGAVSSIAQASATALVLHVALLAPLGEELSFRGLIYRHLRRGLTPLPATLISAGIFSVMHAHLSQSVWAFLLGAVAAFAYEQTRSIVTPVLVHGLFNAVPVGVAAVRSRPDDVGPVWLVLLAVGFVFTLAAHRASKSQPA